MEKKVSVSEKKIFGSDTEIRPRFWFPIPKPGFGHTLYWIHGRGIGMSKILMGRKPNLPFQLIGIGLIYLPKIGGVQSIKYPCMYPYVPAPLHKENLAFTVIFVSHSII